MSIQHLLFAGSFLAIASAAFMIWSRWQDSNDRLQRFLRGFRSCRIDPDASEDWFEILANHALTLQRGRHVSLSQQQWARVLHPELAKFPPLEGLESSSYITVALMLGHCLSTHLAPGPFFGAAVSTLVALNEFPEDQEIEPGHWERISQHQNEHLLPLYLAAGSPHARRALLDGYRDALQVCAKPKLAKALTAALREGFANAVWRGLPQETVLGDPTNLQAFRSGDLTESAIRDYLQQESATASAT